MKLVVNNENGLIESATLSETEVGISLDIVLRDRNCTAWNAGGNVFSCTSDDKTVPGAYDTISIVEDQKECDMHFRWFDRQSLNKVHFIGIRVMHPLNIIDAFQK